VVHRARQLAGPDTKPEPVSAPENVAGEFALGSPPALANFPAIKPPVRNVHCLVKPLLIIALLGASFLAARAAETKSAPAKPAEEIRLFNGKDLTGWKISDFAAQGGVEVETNFRDQGPAIVIQLGEVLSGVTYTNPVPRVDFEISMEAMKLDGSDFFVGLTFPYRTNHATFVCGGWGGGVVGISSIDGADASENESTKFVGFEKNKWYRVKVRVTADRIEAWLDDEQVANIETAGKKIDMRPGEIENAVPISLSTYQTSAACRNVVLRKLTPGK
jgi:hypothetical protein